MEVSFVGENSADASYLAHALESALIEEGVPASALALKQASSENMDLGSILGVSVEAIAQAIGAIGYVACFGKCIFEVAKRHDATVVIVTREGTVKIPASLIDIKRIERALAKPGKAKSKSKG